MQPTPTDEADLLHRIIATQHNMAASKRSRSVSSSGTSSGPPDRHRSPKRHRRSRSRSRDLYRHHRDSRDYRESRYTDDRRRDRHPRSRDDSLDRRRAEHFDRPSGERHRSQHSAHPTLHAPASDAPPQPLSIHRYWCMRSICKLYSKTC